MLRTQVLRRRVTSDRWSGEERNADDVWRTCSPQQMCEKKKRLCSELILICFVLFFLYPNFACSSASLLLNLAVYPSVSRIFLFCFGYQCRLHCAKACFVTFSFIAFESPPPFLGVVFSQLMSVSFTSISHDLLPAMSRRLLC